MKHRTISKTWFEVLEVTQDCTFQELRRAYRLKAFQYHPDRLPGNADRFLAVRRAYEVGLQQIKATPEQMRIAKVQRVGENTGMLVFKGLYYTGMFTVELVKAVLSAFVASKPRKYPDYPDSSYQSSGFKSKQEGYIIINNIQNNQK